MTPFLHDSSSRARIAVLLVVGTFALQATHVLPVRGAETVKLARALTGASQNIAPEYPQFGDLTLCVGQDGYMESPGKIPPESSVFRDLRSATAALAGELRKLRAALTRWIEIKPTDVRGQAC